MRLARLTLYAAAILAGLLGLLLTLLFNFDFGRFRPQAQALLSELLGRQFVIAGPLHLTLDWHHGLELQASDLRLASTEWSAEPEFASLRSLQARVDLRSLFQEGPIIITAVNADGLRLNLESHHSGHDNWTFFEDLDGEDSGAAEDGEPFQLPAFPESIRLTDSALTLRTAGLAQPIRVRAKTITETILPHRELQFTMVGDLNGTGVDLLLSTEHTQALYDLKNLDLSLRGSLGEITLSGDASFDDLLEPGRPEAVLQIHGPDATYLLDILRVEPVTSGPMDLDFVLTPQGGEIRLSVRGSFGDFNLDVQGLFSDLLEMQQIELEVHASGPDIGRISSLLGVEHVPNDPFSLTGRVKRSKTELLIQAAQLQAGDTLLAVDGQMADYSDPSTLRAEVQLAVPEIENFSALLRVPGTLVGRLDARAKVKAIPAGDGADVDASADLDGMSLRARGHIMDNPDLVGTTLQALLQGPAIQMLVKALGQSGLPTAEIDSQQDAQRPETPFRISTELLLTDRGYQVENTLAVAGEEQLTLQGLVGRDPLSQPTELLFDLSSPDLKSALASYGIDSAQFREGAVTAAGKLVGRSGRLELRDGLLTYAGAAASITGELEPSTDMVGSAGRIEINGPDLARLLPENNAMRQLARPFSLSASIGIEDGAVALRGTHFTLADNHLQLDGRLDLDQPLQRGDVRIHGSSPDILTLLPGLSDLVQENKLPLSLQGEVGWANSLWSVKPLDVRLGNATLNIDGQVSAPPHFDRTGLAVSARVPSLHALSTLANRELPDLPVETRFKLRGKGDLIYLDDFTGSLGESDVSGDLSLQHGEIPRVKLALSSRHLDMRPFMPSAPGGEPGTEGTAEVAAVKDKDPKRKVIPDTPLPMEILRDYQADASIYIEELLIGVNTLRDVDVDGSVSNGALAIHHFNVNSDQGGRLAGKLSLTPSSEGAVFKTRTHGETLKVGLPAASADEFDKLPTYDFDLALISEGATVRQLADAANGYLWLESGRGKVKTGALKIFTNDFAAQVVETLNPFAKKDPYAKVLCATVLASVEGGQLVGKPLLVFKTDRLLIMADAEVDLRSEKLKLHFNTVPQKGLGISMTTLVNPYVMVTGTLGGPLMTIDPESTALYGGAAVATGGLSILALGLKDRLLSLEDPCKQAQVEAEKQHLLLEQKYAPSG